MNVQKFLHQLKWDPFFSDIKDQILLDYIHRGAEEDKMTVKFTQITEIRGNFLVIESEGNQNSYDEPLFLPIHRILRIYNPVSYQVFYQKRTNQYQ